MNANTAMPSLKLLSNITGIDCILFHSQLNPPSIYPSLIEDPELLLDLRLAHGDVEPGVEGEDGVEDVRAADGRHVHQDLRAGGGRRHGVVRHRLQAVLCQK